MSNTQQNEIFSLAADLVNYTDKHVFLTGKAGTGKTTFLKYIRENTHKNTAVVAPTGVAAINAGGTTLHSLLHLPFGIFIPEGQRPFHLETREEIHDRQSLVRRTRFAGNKRKMIEALELLIIDEISMVRADLLDMVDAMLRFVRRRPGVPFGGVQVLYIGDMFQLPPVLKDNDRDILKDYYKSPFFFDARVIQLAPPMYVELTHVYRQSDENFIRVLNEVRNNDLSPEGFNLLQKRFIPGFQPPKEENYITLTTHNFLADKINVEELNALGTRTFEFEAVIKDDFPELSYPVDPVLRLKPGAQVMFLKNDLETPRRYFNGKIGIVSDLDHDYIKVKCPDDDEPINVPKEIWRNIRYTYETNTRSVTEEELGTFTQYPLRLAWAITVHKSQGLTFEKAIIDVERAFEAGQVYVALSRCTSLEGMVLSRPIRSNAVMTNERIALFGRKERSLEDLVEKTSEAKVVYLKKKLQEVFGFSDLVLNVMQLQNLFRDFKNIFNASAGDWLEALQEKVNHLQETAKPLFGQMVALLANIPDLEKDEPLRIFLTENAPKVLSVIQETVWPHWRKTPGVQSGETRKSAEAFFTVIEGINDYLKDRILRLERLKNGFSVDSFFGRKLPITSMHEKGAIQREVNMGSVHKPADNSLAAHPQESIPNIELHGVLRKITNEIAKREQVPAYMVATNEMLLEVCKYLPQTTDELHRLKGFGPRKMEWIGEDFLEAIGAYCRLQGLESRMEALPAIEQKNRKKKGQEHQRVTLQTTTAQSLALWKQFKSIDEIAKARNLSVNTIAGHLAQAIENGQLDIFELTSRDTVDTISSLLPPSLEGILMTGIKEQLGDTIGYNEIKWTIAWQRSKRVQQAGQITQT